MTGRMRSEAAHKLSFWGTTGHAQSFVANLKTKTIFTRFQIPGVQKEVFVYVLICLLVNEHPVYVIKTDTLSSFSSDPNTWNTNFPCPNRSIIINFENKCRGFGI